MGFTPLVVPETMVLAGTWVIILITPGLVQHHSTLIGKAMWYKRGWKLGEGKERKKRIKKMEPVEVKAKPENSPSAQGKMSRLGLTQATWNLLHKILCGGRTQGVPMRGNKSHLGRRPQEETP